MFCVGAFYRQAFASISICQPFSFRIFDDVLCWCLLQASFCKHFDLSTFLIQKNLMMFCVGAFYRQAFASILICQPFSFRNIWWCFVLVPSESILICQPFSFRNIWWCFVLVPSTGKLLQAFWFVNLSHSEIFDAVLCWCLLQASFCKHFDLSTFLNQKYLTLFCVGAFYRQAFASILICQPFSFRNIWCCFVLVPSTGKLLQAFWFVNLSHSEIVDDVLCWCLLQASFCKHFDLSTFLIQKYLMMFCAGAFYRQAFASILICQISHSEIFDDVLFWWLLQASFCKHFDLSTFLIQKYLMMFCVGAFYRQAFASILICQPFSFRNIWWCFVLVPSTGKLLQAFWFVNLSHSEIFDDVLCWCLLQASFCKHFALSTFLIQKYLMMFCVGAFYRQAFASISICQPFSFRNIRWCFVLVPSTGKLWQAFWFVNLSHSEIFDDVLCWCLLQASFCKQFDLSTFLIQKYLMMFCVGAFYRQAFASILICQPFSFRNIWWCFVLVPSTGKLSQALRFVNLSHSEIFDDVLCWCLLQASFCKHFDLSTFLIQKYLMMFCVGAFYRQAFASILICQPFSFRNSWWCFVLVPSTGKLLQAFWFVNLSHSEIFDDVLCWCLLQASFCKHFDLSTFLTQKYLMMFCAGAFYRQAFASILICQPFSFRNIWWCFVLVPSESILSTFLIEKYLVVFCVGAFYRQAFASILICQPFSFRVIWWCFVLVPSTGKLLQAFWFVNLSHSEIFDDVLCWCLLQASFCKHFDLSTFLIQKYLMMFCVGAFYRQAFASILICQPFSFRNSWWCFVLVPSTGKLLQAFWFVNLSHSEIFDDVLCWCLLQASFCKHFDLSTFLTQKYLMMFCAGAFYRQAFASILICQPFSFRNIWWCFVLVPSESILSTFLIEKYLVVFCVGAFYRQAFASILICQPFSFRVIWWCFVLVPSTGKLLQAFWFVNLSHSEIFDDVLCWCLLQASFCKHFDLSTFLIQKYLMMFCVGAFYRQAFASILICQPFSFRNIWWCFVLVPSTGKLLQAFWFVNLSHSEIFDDVLCWCLLQASFCKHFALSTFLIQKYLMMFCVGAFYRQAFASILLCQPFSFRNIWWCFVLVPSTGKLLQAFRFVNLSHSEIFDDVLCWCLLQASFCKHFDLSTFLIQKYLMMFCVGAFYRQAFASIWICQPFSFRNIWWCFVLVPSTGKLLQAFWFVNLSHSEIFDDVLCWCLLQASFCKHFDLSTFLIQKYLMMFCVGAFYRQALASILICQPFSFRNSWWCFVLVPSTGKLLQAFWFVNLSHSEIFDDVLCWCLLQASFCKHFDLSTFLIQK